MSAPASVGCVTGRQEDRSPVGYEARCTLCGETFNPSTLDDLEHGVRDDGVFCGGAGVMVGCWR